MQKVTIVNSEDGSNQQVWFYCPGCKSHHAFTVKDPSNHVWTWNNDVEKPTFDPSLLVFASDPDCRCHSFVRDGKIQFLGDCFHELKNQTVELPEIDGFLKKL